METTTRTGRPELAVLARVPRVRTSRWTTDLLSRVLDDAAVRSRRLAAPSDVTAAPDAATAIADVDAAVCRRGAAAGLPRRAREGVVAHAERLAAASAMDADALAVVRDLVPVLDAMCCGASARLGEADLALVVAARLVAHLGEAARASAVRHGGSPQVAVA